MRKWVRYLWTYLYMLLFLLLSRHALAPVRDFVLDDWHHLQTVQGKSLGDIFVWAMRDVYRPVYNTLFWSVFKVLGDRPVYHSGYGIIMQFLLVLAVYHFVVSLSGRRRAGAIAAAMVCCLPIINEPFHFHTTSIVLHAPILYLVSLMAFARYLRPESGAAWCWISAVAYGVAVFSYEYGIFLLPVYFLMWWLRNGESAHRSFHALFPILFMACVYLAWRFTGGFGFGLFTIVDDSYYGGALFDIRNMIHNFRVIISWWVGGAFWRTVADGIYGFQSVVPKQQFALLFLNTLLVCGLIWSRIETSARIDGRTGRVMLILGALALCSYLPFLLSPAASRHNLFPAIALCSIFGLWLDAVRATSIRMVCGLLMVLFMACSQGMATYWKENGQLGRRTFEAIEAHKECWSGNRTILVDTTLLRNRLTHGLGPTSWSITHHGPVYLMPGWVYSSMLIFHAGEKDAPSIIHDREHGARWDGDNLLWHERFDLSRPRSTHRGNIIVLDALTLDFTPCDEAGR